MGLLYPREKNDQMYKCDINASLKNKQEEEGKNIKTN